MLSSRSRDVFYEAIFPLHLTSPVEVLRRANLTTTILREGPLLNVNTSEWEMLTLASIVTFASERNRVYISVGGAELTPDECKRMCVELFSKDQRFLKSLDGRLTCLYNQYADSVYAPPPRRNQCMYSKC